MASTTQKKAKFISKKLKFLKDERDSLINAVELYINGIITAGESWTEGGGDKLEYQELCQMIETAAEFLSGNCEELTGGSMGVAANQHSQPSCEQPSLTSQAITATTSTSATSNIQPAVLVQPADETQLKAVVARIAVIEEALCSFRGNAENVAEQQSDIDQQLKELLSTLSESDKKHSSRFRKVKEQISEISDVQDAINEEHRTRLQSLERQLQKVSTAQDRLDKEVELQAELAEKLVHLPNQLEAVKENVDVLDDRVERIIDDCVKEHIKVLNARTDRIIDECSIKHEDIKTVTDDLVDKVTANTHSIQVISEGQEKKMTLLRQLETKLKKLEADGGRNVKDFQKQAEKGAANLRIVCQMLSDRLTPLEQLRTSLNERASIRDDNTKKLSQVLQDVDVISWKLQQLVLKCLGTSCGFSAEKMFLGGGQAGTISQYEIKYSNVGDNFDADSGIFTAPVDGLYVAYVSLYLTVNGFVYVHVLHQQRLGTESTNVCQCSAAVKNTNACRVGVVDMKAGDKLFTHTPGIPTEPKPAATSCGFRAQVQFFDAVPESISQYKIHYSNVGHSFNADTGIFTAPIDGLYVASISLCLSDNKNISVGVRCQQRLSQNSASVCDSSASVKGTTACCVGVVVMKDGDILFSRVYGADCLTYCCKSVFLSCFLL